jgi:signal transduction histidine kinase
MQLPRRNFISAVRQVPGFLSQKLIQPTSETEDLARREFILNIFLVGSITLLFVASLAVVYKAIIQGADHQGSSPFLVLGIFFSFVTLLILSRKGFIKTTAYIFIGVYFFAISSGLYTYGVDQPQTLLAFALIIVMAGVMISSRFAFIVTFISAAILAILGYLQINEFYAVDGYWKQQLTVGAEDLVTFPITLALIAVASWLSNREIEKSLVRARHSEAELKKERDSLEETVERRTNELKEAQAEKMSQLYRFAEFGKLSSGVFHDLINPLTAVSLNMEKIKNEYGKDGSVHEAQIYIDKAVLAARKMENFVVAVRRQLAQQHQKTSLFSLNEEIQYVVDVLQHKAQTANVSVRFSKAKQLHMQGDAVRFNQIVLNLIANAIEAYPEQTIDTDDRDQEVEVTLHEAENVFVLSVKDNGRGILKENIEKIFEPFFTTKGEDRGLGIGLSLTKRIVEKDLCGVISVTSKEGEGTLFTIQIPKQTTYA